VSAYHVYRFAEFLVRWLPEPIARRQSSAVGRLLCSLQRRNRTILYRNLEVAFGGVKPPAELRTLRTNIFGNFGKFVYEFVHLPRMTDAYIHEIFTPESLPTARRLADMATREPVISVTAHLGHWELGAAIIGIVGCPVAALVDSHPNPRVTDFFDDVRRSRGIIPIPVTAFHRLFRALKNGTLVAMVGDRAVTGQGITMKYFGRDFQAPDGYAVLARRFGAKIVPTFCVAREDGRYQFSTTDPIEIEPTDDVEADIRGCVARYLAVVEGYVLAHPDQWYAFRPIWGIKRPDRMRARRNRVRLSRPSPARDAARTVGETRETRQCERENRRRDR
jgi:KDO2-lipid IV(A) lauroyltransferase